MDMNFKDILDSIKDGRVRTDLVIVPNTSMRNAAIIAMVDQAHVLAMFPQVNMGNSSIAFEDSNVLFRVAHLYLGESMAGRPLTSIKGLEYVEDLQGDNAKCAEQLMACLR
jgi:hypothetical protein